jgi:hypothetical protein
LDGYEAHLFRRPYTNYIDFHKDFALSGENRSFILMIFYDPDIMTETAGKEAKRLISNLFQDVLQQENIKID